VHITYDEGMSMRAGMTRGERLALRESILEHALAGAREEAARAFVSAQCTYAQTTGDHNGCRKEAAGDGCLCPCHDPAEHGEAAAGAVAAAEASPGAAAEAQEHGDYVS
jgi:hypothetical protein